MIHALTFRVAVALVQGAMLQGGGVTARPFEPKRFRGRFICHDRAGGLVDAPELHDETTSMASAGEDRRGAGCVWVTRTRHDWSAYGAARAFVSRCKVGEIEAELKRWARARGGHGR